MTRKETMEISKEIMGIIRDVIGSKIPPKTREKVDEMGKLAVTLNGCLDAGAQLPPCLTDRYNELSNELFPPRKEDGEDKEDHEDCERYCVRECEDNDSDMPEELACIVPVARLVRVVDWYVWASPDGGLHVKHTDDDEGDD